MQNEVFNGKTLMEGIDALREMKVQNRIPLWVRLIDWTLTGLYLSGFIALIVWLGVILYKWLSS